MDKGDASNRSSADCETLPILDQIKRTAQPPLDLARANLHQIQGREPNMFFPQRAIKEIFVPKDGESPVKKVLQCRYKTCSRIKAPKNEELKRTVEKITQDGLGSSMIMLAIFIYINHGYLIRRFGPYDRASDISLDSVTEQLLKHENLEASKKVLNTADVDAFCDIYSSARDIFKPPIFHLEGPTQPFADSYRMPFLEDEPHAEGASGKVRKFNIHEDYLDEKIKNASWYRNSSSKFKFARKILSKETSREVQSNIERENLAVFTRERHMNIIQAVCFYQWREHMNFVFPFIEGTLEKLLGEGELKISDFGLSIIKRIDPSKTSYGYFRGGTPKYQAPELFPSTGEGVVSSDANSATSSAATYEAMPNTYKNKCDVWSYACIALEVLVYLSGDNGISMLKQFEKEVDTEPRGPAFFSNRKLKNCVGEAIRRISRRIIDESENSRHSIWAYETISFLQRMFDFEPESKPTSAEVAESFQRINTEYANSPSDELETELRGYSRREYPTERFDEMHWRTANGDLSFINMEGISFTWPDAAVKKWHDCKLKIYCDKIDGHFVIVRSFEEDKIVRSREQSLAGAEFLPLYAYSNQGGRECGIRDKDRDVHYCFQSKHDLDSFQDVLLHYHPLWELNQSIRSINLKSTHQLKVDPKSSGCCVQIWAGSALRGQGTASYPVNPGLSTNVRPGSEDHGANLISQSSRVQPIRESIKYGIMIFLEGEYVRVPLSEGHPQLSYGKAGVVERETIVVYQSSTTIKILPNRIAGHKHFEVWQTHPTAKVKSKGRVPGISLCPTESDHATVKAGHIVLQFETPAETQAFANAFKTHNTLRHYWQKCVNEEKDEKNSSRV